MAALPAECGPYFGCWAGVRKRTYQDKCSACGDAPVELFKNRDWCRVCYFTLGPSHAGWFNCYSDQCRRWAEDALAIRAEQAGAGGLLALPAERAGRVEGLEEPQAEERAGRVERLEAEVAQLRGQLDILSANVQSLTDRLATTDAQLQDQGRLLATNVQNSTDTRSSAWYADAGFQ